MLPFFLLRARKSTKNKPAFIYFTAYKTCPSAGRSCTTQTRTLQQNQFLHQAKQKAHPPGTTKPLIICVLCGGDAGINDHHSAVPAPFFFQSRKNKTTRRKLILYMHNTVDKITECSFQTFMSFSYNVRLTR